MLCEISNFSIKTGNKILKFMIFGEHVVSIVCGSSSEPSPEHVNFVKAFAKESIDFLLHFSNLQSAPTSLISSHLERLRIDATEVSNSLYFMPGEAIRIRFTVEFDRDYSDYYSDNISKFIVTWLQLMNCSHVPLRYSNN